MLVLTRRTSEKLMIGDEIQLNILAINGNQVRIGITAPRDISIYREEIYKKIMSENDSQSQHKED